MNRWIEHYSELYSVESSVWADTLVNLPNSPVRHYLDAMPEIDEVESTILKLKNGKAAGEDEIPSELYKAGITSLAIPRHHIISACWSTGSVPQAFKDAKITTLYKQKGDRGDCNNYRGII